MIIVSQGNNIIANFDNITSLDIDRSNGRYIVECNFTNKNNIYLGEYATEERAKEILQEIVKMYVDGKKANEGNRLFGGIQWIPVDTLYEMPKE